MNALTSATGGPDDNDAQAGHLVYVKAARSGAPLADGSLPPETWAQGGVSTTLNTFDNGTESRATVLAVTPIQDSRSLDKAQNGLGIGRDGDPAYTLDTTGSQAVSITGDRTHALTAEGHDESEDGTGRGTPIVFSHTAGLDAQASTDVAPSVLAGHDRMPATSGQTGVRRLTPVECERLQGFPDDWTALRDADTPQADSSRYRQLGNAVAVPVVEWILGRLVAADLDTKET